MAIGRFPKSSSGFEVLSDAESLVMSYLLTVAHYLLQSAVRFYTASSCLLPEVSMLVFLPTCLSHICAALAVSTHCFSISLSPLR